MHSGMLLERQASGLSAADALRLEEHLADCATCRTDAETLQGLRTLSTQTTPQLGRAARERAIRNALREAQAVPAADTHPAAGMRAPVSIAVALCAAAVLLIALRPSMSPTSPSLSQERARPPQAAVAVRIDRVLSGEMEIDGRVASAGTLLGTASLLRAPQAATLALAHAKIELAAGSTLRWDAATHSVHLQSGSLLADVDEAPHAPFAVVTPRFTVLVLGTRFLVTLDGVRVERGRVRVTAPDGRVLADAVLAGERFAYENPTPFESTSSVSAQAQRNVRAEAGHPQLGALLREVREHLAAQRLHRARELLEQAATLPGAPAEHADAMSLRAECALLSGDHADAIETYLKVARRFGQLPAGENALFAAARLEAERARAAAASQLLERYLQSYPKGRFVKEAQARLRTLAVDLDREP
jgi:ferric-dicitrate binding protein FerR (iron transport regulator)